MKHRLTITVNGESHEIFAESRRTLLEVLREDLHLLGTREICGEGECGACTVLLDGVPVNSCLVLAVDVNGRQVETIEGLAPEGRLHPIQQEFIAKGAIQCGYCTSGMIMTAKAFLASHPSPDEEQIRGAIEGNFCRCTGYARIVEAIRSSAQRLSGAQEDA
ncbi:MAG: (2Fe-2S)-binding protein [Desulfarculus sp.]|nr:MAG: (2Fe-2S)-binding protein [Desulfarculus sp.]